jgi:hypothetical protein
MSRYGVDKAMWELIHGSPELRRRFVEDPHGFLDGRELEPEERAALATQDVATLYGSGAHPFLLWGWWGRLGEGDAKERRERYPELVEPFGYPDFGT